VSKLDLVSGWSCDERNRSACRNPHGCHCREITALRTVPKAKAAPNRVEIAMMVDPEAFIDAMLQDDLTPSERVYFYNNRQTEKLNALKKADDILAALSLSRPQRRLAE
jgi:hypothetical protein